MVERWQWVPRVQLALPAEAAAQLCRLQLHVLHGPCGSQGKGTGILEMLQASCHTRLHFQAQTHLFFRKEPGCSGVTTVTSRNCESANEGRWAGLSNSLSSEPQEPRSVPSFQRRDQEKEHKE